MGDQKRFIEIMEVPRKNQEVLEQNLKAHFREVDEENIGVVTRPEFLKIIKNLGLKLDEKEQKEVLDRVDNENTGMV